jgi:transposase
MRMFAGLDVGFKRTVVCVCVVDEAGRIVWREVVDTHPEALSRALQHWGGKLAKIGLESGSMWGWRPSLRGGEFAAGRAWRRCP